MGGVEEVAEVHSSQFTVGKAKLKRRARNDERGRREIRTSNVELSTPNDEFKESEGQDFRCP